MVVRLVRVLNFWSISFLNLFSSSWIVVTVSVVQLCIWVLFYGSLDEPRLG